MWKDFKNFISRGIVIDLSVGVAIGAAFTKIVNTVANDLISPLISLIGRSGMDFKDKFVNLSGQDLTGMTIQEISEKDLPVFHYGELITDVIDLLIVAFVVFLISRLTAKYFKALEAAPPPMTKSEELLQEIRDHLVKGNVSPVDKI